MRPSDVPGTKSVQGNTESQKSPPPFPATGEEEQHDRRANESGYNDFEIPELRRETHAECEVFSCRATREEYGVGYKCWKCGHIQHSHNGSGLPRDKFKGYESEDGLLYFLRPQFQLASWANL